jgi:hypothetical protein
MQRFGRSAQQRLKDRWGGGFILATILALLAAWWAGGKLGDVINNKSANGTNKGGPGLVDTSNPNGSMMTAEPQEFKLYFVQVGAFSSAANARGQVAKMNDLGMTAVIAPEVAGLHPVWVGPYLDQTSADEAKAKLTGENVQSTARPVAVAYNTNAVPVAATGADDTQLRQGMDTLNVYLHEVALWLENRNMNPAADPSTVLEHGKALGELATKLKNEKDTRVHGFATMAEAAGKNAADIEAVAASANTDAKFQAAMTGYLNLLGQYNNFQAGK